MTNRPRSSSRVLFSAFTLAMFGVLTVSTAQPALAQTFTVLHTFTGGADGGNPFAGLTMGGPGLFYGTAENGGTHQDGVVFKLVHRGSGWTLNPLYEFQGGNDGLDPLGPITIGPNGALYGTTQYGGGRNTTGTVFELQPPATECRTSMCYWSETILHSFHGGPNDGGYPFYTKLIFDQAGNIYGTTELGGAYGVGTVFELSPSDRRWTLSLLHSFSENGIDGYEPLVGVIFDPAGNLYGATWLGGNSGGEGGGTVFQLSPSGGTWTENILYDFPLDSLGGPSEPGALIMGQSGNLYGATAQGGDGSNGTVFELTPSGGSWVYSLLYNFANDCFTNPVTLDTAGNLYGTCVIGGRYGYGLVFKLTNSGGSWTYTDLHDFIGGSEGGIPFGALTLDASGNVYGTTSVYGNLYGCTETGPGCGTVWEITP